MPLIKPEELDPQFDTHEQFETQGSTETLPATQEKAISDAPAIALMSAETLAEQGYAGFKLDWTSFPQMSLKTEGYFEDYDKNNFGNSFMCRVFSTRPRYCYRSEKVVGSKKEKRLYYSYDKKTLDSGDLLEDALNVDRAEGFTVSSDEYLEAFVQLHAPGTAFDGEYRTLSISPSSKGRFWGTFMIASKVGADKMSSVLWKMSVGQKITGVANPYYPWAFSLVN